MQLVFLFPALCSPVLKPNLHPGLGQPQPLAQLFPHEGIRVMGLIEKPLQLVQLLQGEVGAASPLLDLCLSLFFQNLHVLLPFLHIWGHPCTAGETVAPGGRWDKPHRGAAGNVAPAQSCCDLLSVLSRYHNASAALSIALPSFTRACLILLDCSRLDLCVQRGTGSNKRTDSCFSRSIMGRHSSDSEENTRTRKKKKHRRRSSSSSSSDGQTRRHKKSGKRSRSRSREAYSSSHSYDKRRRHRSSSESSYNSRRRRSSSRSRDRVKSRKAHRSRRSRSKSRHRQRSRSRSSDRSSRRRSRSKSYERERGKGRMKEKTREKERRKEKESTSKFKDSINIKAGLEHLSPAEQAKATLQMVLQAAAKADEVLRAKERSEEEARRRKEEDQSLLLDQVKRVKEIEAIESDSFLPQVFRSSRDTKVSAETSDSKHESAILGVGTFDFFGDEKEEDVSTMPTAIKYLDDNSIAHPNLYIEKAEAEEKWYKRLTSLRNKRLMGSPVA